MIIRLMGQDDLPLIAEIELEYPSPWSPAQLSSEYSYADALSLVAEDINSNIIGWCTVRCVEPEAELLKIAVRPDCRGKGIAGELLHRVAAILAVKDIKSLFLEVRSQNTSALRLYRKNGFVKVGERLAYYSNPKDNALILKKEFV